jgi:hypothetical protein
MAVYQITDPDGAVYRINGPENARQEDLIRAVQQQTQQLHLITLQGMKITQQMKLKHL